LTIIWWKKDHLTQLQKCLHECCINGIMLNPEKCAFCVNYEVLLKYVVYHKGLLVNPRKVIVITNMATTTKFIIKLKWFLGATQFYKDISMISPLKRHANVQTTQEGRGI
jgi:hypothetical protein